MSDQSETAPRDNLFSTSALGHYSLDFSPEPMITVEGPKHLIRYMNPAFALLVGKKSEELVGLPFVEAVSQGIKCFALLDRVFGTGVPEKLFEEEHHDTSPSFWSYSAWSIFGGDGRPVGLMIQVTDSTEVALFRHQAAAMNEELVLSSVRQHELVESMESLNARLREAHDWLEERVAERTAELGTANGLLREEIRIRQAAEAERLVLLRRLATAQEDERRLISRNLHDQMGQLLTALGLGLKALEAATPDPSPGHPHLSRLRELTDRIGREFHQLALDLRPTALDDLGLQTALTTYAEAWSKRSGVSVDFQSTFPNTGRLNEAVETALYRVVQEALTNVLRHAEAQQVSLVLQWSPGQAAVVVEDNGVGFDSESAMATAGRLGLLGMRERVTLVGGTLTIESSPGRGTTVIARVPLAAEEMTKRDG